MDSNLSSSNYLSLVEDQLTYSLIIPLILGVVGNCFCCVIFRQKQFRSNAISTFFTAGSITNIIVLIYGIGINLDSVDHRSLDQYSLIFCQVRLYIRHTLLMIVRSYVVLACIASFSLSSSRMELRSLFRPKFVQWCIFLVPLIWPLIALHMPFFTIIRENRCIYVDSYMFISGIYFFFVVGIFPVLLMTLFILLTVKNLNSLHRRIQPSIVTPIRLKSRDQHFIRMLSSLVLMYITTNIFYPTNVLYLAMTNFSTKSEHRIAIESLIFFLTSNYILYINSVSPFFLFFWSSTAFRRSFYSIVDKYKQHLLGTRFRRRRASTSGALTECN